MKLKRGTPPRLVFTAEECTLLAEVLQAASRPLGFGAVAGLAAFGVGLPCESLPPLARLVIQSSVLLVVYGALLYFAGGQKQLYLEVLRGLDFRGRGEA